MPEVLAFDVDTPSPDRGHEAIRVAVVEAVADLRRNIADTADGFYLADVIFEFLDAVLLAVDDLTVRVETLETAALPEEPPVAD